MNCSTIEINRSLNDWLNRVSRDLQMIFFTLSEYLLLDLRISLSQNVYFFAEIFNSFTGMHKHTAKFMNI